MTTRLDDLINVHLIGIKGTGMSAMALLLHSLGIHVTGSDTTDAFLLLPEKYFSNAQIHISSGFDKKNVTTNTSAVIVSSSHRSKNPEVMEAEARGIPVLTYAEMTGLLSRTFRTIAVCGSHGKTTTTNLLAHVLQEAGLPVLALAGPTSEQVLQRMLATQDEGKRSSKAYRSSDGSEIAGRDFQQKINDRFAERLPSSTPLFVLEADEYENKLALYSPFSIILTNVERDHPDYFKTDAEYEQVFTDFIKKIPQDGFLIDGRSLPFTQGEHFAFDAKLVTLAAQKLGVSDESIKRSIASFAGSPRRMQKVSDHPLIYDDYGHHPTEIKTTLKALRNTYPDKKIIAVFHPHTFTRTKEFLEEFGESFVDADYTVCLEIWGSARETHGTVSSQDVVDLIKRHGGKADYAATFEDAAALVRDKLSNDTVLLTIGAGDVWKLHEFLL